MEYVDFLTVFENLLMLSTSTSLSNNVVPDLNENIGRSTDLENKWNGSADLHTPIHSTLFLFVQLLKA